MSKIKIIFLIVFLVLICSCRLEYHWSGDVRYEVAGVADSVDIEYEPDYGKYVLLSNISIPWSSGNCSAGPYGDSDFAPYISIKNNELTNVDVVVKIYMDDELHEHRVESIPPDETFHLFSSVW